MVVGVPKEVKDHETRVALVPSGVMALCEAGHEVLVQTGAGAESAIPDDRIDEILHALHRIQGEIADLRITVAELAARLPAAGTKPTPSDGSRGGA